MRKCKGQSKGSNSASGSLRTAVVFLTLDSLCQLWDEQDDKRVTLCIVSDRETAAFSDVGIHSSLLSLSSSSSEGHGSTPLFLSSFHLLFTHNFVCVLCRTFATDVNMHDLGVCSPPNGLEKRPK